MRRILLFLALFSVCATRLVAQNYDSDYYFVYITRHDLGPANLIKFLEQDYANAIDEDQTWIFYLANGFRPVIVEVSPENHNREAFDDMLEIIGRNQTLECFPDADLDILLEFFDEKDFVDSQGRILYNSVSWRIYCNPQFWNTDRDFIPNLFWVFDFVSLNKVNGFDFTFEVYINMSYPALSFDEEKPFGLKNMGNINNIVGLMDYDLR